MFFRNLVMFRFSPLMLWQTGTDPMEPEKATLQDLLADAALKPVGPLELSSRGFVSPFGRDSDVLFAQAGDALWLTVGGEDKILPGAVVNEALQKKLAEIEAKEGRKPGGKTRKRIKDDLLHELLPKAFVKPSRVDVCIDVRRGVVAVDTASRKVGEGAVSEIRRALGSFPALPLNAEVAPRSVLTGWISGEPLPDGLWMGEDAELRTAMEGGSVIKCQDTDLRSDEVTAHLATGMQCAKLALTMDDCVSFVLGEDLVVRKLKFLDGAVDRLENTEHDDLRAELDARFALMAGELGRLFDVLEPALKLSKAEA